MSQNCFHVREVTLRFDLCCFVLLCVASLCSVVHCFALLRFALICFCAQLGLVYEKLLLNAGVSRSRTALTRTSVCCTMASVCRPAPSDNKVALQSCQGTTSATHGQLPPVDHGLRLLNSSCSSMSRLTSFSNEPSRSEMLITIRDPLLRPSCLSDRCP